MNHLPRGGLDRPCVFAREHRYTRIRLEDESRARKGAQALHQLDCPCRFATGRYRMKSTSSGRDLSHTLTPDWFGELCRVERLPEGYESVGGRVIAPLVDRITALGETLGRTAILGICGAQGSGKSTLGLFLGRWLEREVGLAVATLSLDDLYLTRAQRRELAETRHPLFRTRGVPGTHDIDLGMRVLDDLVGGTGPAALPRFEKAADDRAAVSDWPSVEAPVDVVLFDGWCVGARPQGASALGHPVNELEADEDADGRWRRDVNDRLATDYATLFSRLDALVFLRVPSFSRVLAWRGLQELKLTGNVDSREMLRFVSHFERLTRHILETMPAYADAVIDIDDEHRMAAPRFGGRLARRVPTQEID